MPAVRFLNSASADGYASMAAAFRMGLKEAGYADGQNVAIEYRWADNQYKLLPALAVDLVNRQVKLIFANSPSIPAALAATKTIPIVFNSGDDPVRLGFVAVLSRPGGNAPGVAIFSGELAAKRLELLRELIPSSKTSAVLINVDFGPSARFRTDVEAAARALGVATPILQASGATESDNLAIKGVAESPPREGQSHHHAGHRAQGRARLCKRLEKSGYEVTYLPVAPDGLIDLDELRRAITPKTILISIMHANNEIGVIQPVDEIGKIAKENKILFHWTPCKPSAKFPSTCRKTASTCSPSPRTKSTAPKASARSTSAAKTRAWNFPPSSTAAATNAACAPARSMFPASSASAKPAKFARRKCPKKASACGRLRDKLKDSIMSRLDGTAVNGSMAHRLPNNLNLSFSGVEGDALLMGINDVAVSSGSACTSAMIEPSYVLRALGVSDDLSHSSIRFGLGRFNTEEEVDYVADRVVETVKRLRELSPLFESASHTPTR